MKTIDRLPELPFKQVLSYLSLGDRLRMGTVSRSCHQKIHNTRVSSLCFSDRPSGFILGKSRWISGTFSRNFINSTRFASFFNAFRSTILSNLKHLRFCDLELKINSAIFAQTINSFDQLQELTLIRLSLRDYSDQEIEFELNLPMLTGIYLDEVAGIQTLTLDAPRLREVRLVICDRLRLVITCGESVERLIATRWEYTAVSELKNLRCLHLGYHADIDAAILCDLDQLREVQLISSKSVKQLFEQRRRYGKAVDLKIRMHGYLLNGPDDPAFDFLSTASFEDSIIPMIANPSRLADGVSFWRDIPYTKIEHVAPELVNNLMNKFTEFDKISFFKRVQDIEHLLNIFKNFANISELEFCVHQPQDLFDRLPEHCAVQKLLICYVHSDLRFLFKLKHLIHLVVYNSIGVKLIREFFERLPFLSNLNFYYKNRRTTIIKIDKNFEWTHPKRFQISFERDWTYNEVPDLETAIQHVEKSCS